jgi:hypothetical protein
MVVDHSILRYCSASFGLDMISLLYFVQCEDTGEIRKQVLSLVVATRKGDST